MCAARARRRWAVHGGRAVDANGHVEAVGLAGGDHRRVRGVGGGPGAAVRRVARRGRPGARRGGARGGPEQLRRGHGQARPRAAGAGRERQHRADPRVRDHGRGGVGRRRAPRRRTRGGVGRRRPRRRHHRGPGPSQARRRRRHRGRRPHQLRAGRPAARHPRSRGGQEAGRRRPAGGPPGAPAQRGAVLEGARPGWLALRRAEGAGRPGRQDAQLRRCLGRRLHRRGLHRGRARRWHRLRPPRPGRHVAGLVGPHRCQGRLERLAQGVRPLRHAPVAGRTRPDRPGPVVVRGHGAGELRPRHGQLLGRVRHQDRAVAQLRRPGRHQHALLPLPGPVDEVGQRAPGQPPRRSPAAALRGAPGVPRHRPQHGRRVRHGLRRPRQRLPVRRREARHQGLARLVPRRQRRRLHRPVGRAPLLHLGRGDADPRRPRRVRHARPVVRARQAPGLDRRLRPGDRGPRHPHRIQRGGPGRHQRPGAEVQRPEDARPHRIPAR